MNKMIAIYCRLSREDGENESLSITNQKEILKKYCFDNICDNLDNYKYYIDDGYTGTNFNRPSFIEMIEDVKKKKIEMVIVKDLSRLGRNYLEVGYYTEEFFPKYNIRFIAVNDNYDSNNENEFAPFKNIINEWYAKDISKKVRFTLDNNAKKGNNRKTAIPLYGYKYNDNNERIIDECSSEIVRNIFNNFIIYKSISKVQEILKVQMVHTPGYYNYLKYNYKSDKYYNISKDERYLWLKETIMNILKNKEYTGCFITKKTYTKNYKHKKRIKNQESETYLFDGKYPAIITYEIYNQVQNIFCSKARECKRSEVNAYQGLLKCGNCLNNLMYQKSKKRYCCVNKKCHNRVSISLDILEQIISKELKYLKGAFKDIIEKQSFNSYVSIENQEKINKLKKRNDDLKLYIRRIITSKVCDDVVQECLNDYQKEYQFNIKEIEILHKDEDININEVLNNCDLKEYIKDIISIIYLFTKKIEGKKITEKKLEIYYYDL